MVHIVLVEPEIPQNTGNIARTCAVTHSSLHLIRPLGFEVSERAVRRAGLDYWSQVSVTVYEDLTDFFTRHPDAEQRLWAGHQQGPPGLHPGPVRGGLLPVLRKGDRRSPPVAAGKILSSLCPHPDGFGSAMPEPVQFRRGAHL